MEKNGKSGWVLVKLLYSLQYSNVKYTVVIYLLNGFPFFLFNFFLFILSRAVD